MGAGAVSRRISTGAPAGSVAWWEGVHWGVAVQVVIQVAQAEGAQSKRDRGGGEGPCLQCFLFACLFFLPHEEFRS